MTKSKPVAYCERKFMTTSRKSLLQQLEDMPIKRSDYAFIVDVINGMPYKELAEKYNKSVSRIGKWKHDVCAKILQYDSLS